MEVTDFSQVAILVRSTKMQEMIDGYLDIPHRVVISTPLDDDLNPRSHLLRSYCNTILMRECHLCRW